MDTKPCTACQLIKPLADYYFEKRSQRHLSKCKVCTKAYIKLWRTSSGGQVRVRAQYRRLKVAGLRSKPYCEKTPEQKRASADAVRRWRSRNMERFRSEDGQSRRLVRSAAFQAAWPVIVRHYGSKCLCCGKGETFFDHVQPLSKQGANALANGQPLCRACNTMKEQMQVPTDYRPDKGAWIAALVCLNAWLAEPTGDGQWHLSAEGRARCARLKQLQKMPLLMPVDGMEGMEGARFPSPGSQDDVQYNNTHVQ